MTRTLLLTVALSLFSNALHAGYCWISKADAGVLNRGGAYGFVINGKAYVAGGYDNGTGMNDTWEYDPIANTWTQKASIPGTVRWAGASFSLNGKGYISLGLTPTGYTGTTYEYNAVSNTWTSKTAFLLSPRQDVHSFSINNNGYVLSGYNSSGYYNDLVKYDPVTDTWSALASIPGPNRDGRRGFEIGNIAYVMGGYSSSLGNTNDVYAYDVTTNTWSLKNPFPGIARHSMAAFSMNGTGFAGNGRGGSSQQLFPNDFYEYNAATDTWIPIPDFPGLPLAYPATFNLLGSGYIATGMAAIGLYNNETWMLGYTPEALFTPAFTTCNLTVSFTNSSTGGTSYAWDFGDGNTSSLVNPSHTYSTVGNYTVTLIASNGSCHDTVTQSVTLQASPLTASFTLSTDCSNTVTINSFSTTATGMVWLWGDGQQTLGPATSHTYPSGGSYTLGLVLTSGACTDTLYYPVTLNPQPAASFTAATSCDFGVTLVNTSQSCTSYLWDWGNGVQDTGSVAAYTYPAPGTYTITLTGFNGVCSDTVTQTVTITPPVTATFTATPDCNQGVTVQNTSSGAASYVWHWGDGTTASTGTYHTYAFPGTFTLMLIAVNGACSDTSSLTLSIDTVPESVISYSYSLCHDTVYLSPAQPAANYFWDLGNGQTSAATQLAQVYATPGNYTVTLVSSNAQCSDTAQVAVLALTTPAASITATNHCNGSFSAATIPDTSFTFFWETGDGSSYTDPSISHTYAAPGNYVVHLTVANGFCSVSDSVDIEISIPVDYVITTTIDSCTRTVGYELDPVPASAVIWEFGDGATGNGMPAQHTFASPVMVTTLAVVNPASVCPDSATTVLDLASISESGLFLPNCFTPNDDSRNDFFHVASDSYCDFESISIYNRWGMLVFESSNPRFRWNGTYSGQDAPSGVYVYFLKTGKKHRHGVFTLLR